MAPGSDRELPTKRIPNSSILHLLIQFQANNCSYLIFDSSFDFNSFKAKMATIKECVVPYCTSIKGRTTGISYHEFPSDEKIRSLWIGNISRQASRSDKTPWVLLDRLALKVMLNKHFEF
jgi:hypothetical protein